MKKVKTGTSAKAPAGLYWDAQRRTCLVLERERGQTVQFIPLVVSTSFRVQKLTEPKFDAIYKAVEGQSAEDLGRHCGLFLRYAMTSGATAEVLDFLAQHTKVTKEQRGLILARVISEPVDEKAPALRDKSKVKKNGR